MEPKRLPMQSTTQDLTAVFQVADSRVEAQEGGVDMSKHLE